MGYWQFYEPARPIEVKGGLKARSKRGKIGQTWWSERWIGLLESFNMGARLTRGRAYARKGQVISLDVEKGMVRARVQGTRSEPYQVRIRLKPISEKEWKAAEKAMASRAVFAARLLSGEMPQEIEEAFVEAGVSLFPQKKKELDTECSCPDWANPCKHIAAVYYLLAESFDLDPFLIFKLRGRTREETLEALRELRASSGEGETDAAPAAVPGLKDSVPALEDCLDSYWLMGHSLESLTFKPALPEVENAVLKRLGEAPFSVGKENMASLLEKAYRRAGRAACKKAYGEPEGFSEGNREESEEAGTREQDFD
ncbi:MAG: hypothetical protein GKC10_05670 [Methanosarcinales archaeon]|nr:hypothetical protein [Methanosarcinales archaeon]